MEVNGDERELMHTSVPLIRPMKMHVIGMQGRGYIIYII